MSVEPTGCDGVSIAFSLLRVERSPASCKCRRLEQLQRSIHRTVQTIFEVGIVFHLYAQPSVRLRITLKNFSPETGGASGHLLCPLP